MFGARRILIPSFQREFVWEREDIIRLWDSIYRFYPIGSMLCWETNIYLHIHRKLGGFVFPNDEETIRKFRERVYILDGQQRTTSLLLSIFGGKGKVKGQLADFDYTLHFDAIDAMFFFANEFNKRKRKANPVFLIRLKDTFERPSGFYRHISAESGFNQTIEDNLRQLSRVLPESCTKYRSEAQKALCLKRSWRDFDPQAYYLYGEDQNHETSFKAKALQAVVDSWCKNQVLTDYKIPLICVRGFDISTLKTRKLKPGCPDNVVGAWEVVEERR